MILEERFIAWISEKFICLCCQGDGWIEAKITENGLEPSIKCPYCKGSGTVFNPLLRRKLYRKYHA